MGGMGEGRDYGRGKGSMRTLYTVIITKTFPPGPSCYNLATRLHILLIISRTITLYM